MKSSHMLLAGVLASSSFGLIGCYPNRTTTAYETQPALTAAPSSDCSSCGTITSIDRSGGTYGGTSSGAYRVTVRLDNGQDETITQSTQPAFRVGDRVQILNQPVQ